MKLRKFLTTITIITLASGCRMSDKAYAVEQYNLTPKVNNYNTISPFWTNIDDVLPSIAVDGTTLNASVYVVANSSSSSISGTMYLEKYSSGRWTTVTSWNVNGTGTAFASKNYRGTSGTKYRTRVVVTVDGEKAEAISSTLVL